MSNSDKKLIVLTTERKNEEIDGYSLINPIYLYTIPSHVLFIDNIHLLPETDKSKVYFGAGDLIGSYIDSLLRETERISLMSENCFRCSNKGYFYHISKEGIYESACELHKEKGLSFSN